MSEYAEGKRGILITAPNGTLYNIPEKELARFAVTPENVEATILDAEAAGFIETQQPAVSDQAVVTPPASAPTSPVVINVFVNHESEVRTPAVDQVAPNSMAKYAGGTAMAKYAGGTSMAKYAGGTAMAKYAGGTSLGFGHPSAGPSNAAAAVFYGDWVPREEEKRT
jgi:hypothetical protein